MRGILQWRPWAVLLLAASLTSAIAVTDWNIVFEATLGFLYMFPLVLLGTIWGWKRLLLAAAFCTYLSDKLDPFPVDMQVPRNALIYITLATAGLLARTVAEVIAAKWTAWREWNRRCGAGARRKSNWSFWWKAVRPRC